MMLEHLRSEVIDLKCRRYGLESWHGRQVDLLPDEERVALEVTLVAELTVERLELARITLTQELHRELSMIDARRAGRLAPAIRALTEPTRCRSVFGQRPVTGPLRASQIACHLFKQQSPMPFR